MFSVDSLYLFSYQFGINISSCCVEMIGIVKPFSVLCEAFVAEMIQQWNLLGFADSFRGMNTESLWYESWGEAANISWIC